MAPNLPDGAILGRVGSYELVRLLGEGSMGRVYEARHTKLERTVAIKMLRSEQAKDAALVKRFFQEARTVSRINHPHIVEISDFVEDVDDEGQARAYCVMEYLPGRTLATELEQGPLGVERIRRIADHLCQALTAAHEVGVIHRDIKPENLILGRTSDGQDCVKVLDFGVAKLMRPDPVVDVGRTHDGAIIGTPKYMSPEQAASLEVDERADIYAIGCVLYEMLTGRPPFEGDAFGPLVARILTQQPEPPGALTASGEKMPQALAALAMECLEKAPEQRPSSVEQVRRRLWVDDAALSRRGRLRAPLVASAGLSLVALSVFVLQPEVQASSAPTLSPGHSSSAHVQGPEGLAPGIDSVRTGEVQKAMFERPDVLDRAEATGDSSTTPVAAPQIGARENGKAPASTNAAGRRAPRSQPKDSRDGVLNPFAP